MSARLRNILLAALVLSSPRFAVAAGGFAAGTFPASYLRGMPAGAEPAAIALDSDGNILLAGAIQPPGKDSTARQAFAAKVAPDGQTLLYLNVLGGGAATALAADNAGNTYVAGGTWSADFPTTAGAWNTVYRASGPEAFVVKLDRSGNVVYSTLFGSTDYTYPRGIAVNAAGEAYVTGQTTGGGFPLVGGAIPPSYPPNSSFLVRLSAAGDKAIYSVTGPGGSAIAVDEQDSAYTVGTAAGAYQVPITPNAYQRDVQAAGCGGGAQLQVPCLHQFVCKVDASASKLYFCTFVSGTYGEAGPSIAVDASHNIYLAGTTQATDYPVTSGALQSQNRVQLPPPPLDPPGYPSIYQVFQPTGYFSKLSADGTQLLYSTYLGGSQADYPGGIAIDAGGKVFVAASVQSPDYPGLPPAPQRCLPDRLHPTPVLTFLDSEGAHSVVVAGPATTARMALDPKSGVWLVSGADQLTRIPIGGVTSQDAIACITDALDFRQAGPIVPGQLVTIFGNQIGPKQPAAFPPDASPPTALGGVTVTIGGIAAPLLYVSEGQINLQVPATLAPTSALAELRLSKPDGATVQRTLPVTASNPSLATNGTNSYPVCNGQSLVNGTVYVLMLNPDGTLNSCGSPAPVGSQLLAVLNGAGTQIPTVTDRTGNLISATLPATGFPGVWVVVIHGTVVYTPSSGTPLFTSLNLLVNGTPAREQSAAVWLTR